MIIQSLTGKWQFRQVGTREWLPAIVPGEVHTDLQALSMIPDPFVGDNELKVMWVAEADWEYRFTFILDPDLVSEEKQFLVADGVDTLAIVSINDLTLGETNNQFCQWCWEITEKLHPGENVIELHFSGPSAYVAQEQVRRKLKGVSQAIEGGPHLRKAPCQFGWDWGPKLPSIGIWKDIRLEGRSIAKLQAVHIRQFHHDGEVVVQAEVIVESWRIHDLFAELIITAPDGKVLKNKVEIIADKATIKINVTDPHLWWPNGYGNQDLYNVLISLKTENKTIDQKEYKIGLRTVVLSQEDDEFGKSFTFIVNNVPIFVKGSNWIPVDSFIPRFSDQRLERLIADAAASHQNMLRVWGGGLYEEERFYDLCDKYGILVWQDFIFSCSIYPLDEINFFENVRIEALENIKRLRHRASLALWCGNNEMEWGWESWGWQKHPLEEQLPALVEQYPQLSFLLDMVGQRDLLPDWEVLMYAYDQFFHHTLPEWITDVDPDTPYWPSSPSSNTPFRNANSQSQGDAHFWDVWHGRKPFTAYRSILPRFMSEFGFQAFPTMNTIKFYAEPEDLNLTSYIMEHHQRGNHGNGLIIAQMTDMFRMPKDFTAWIYLSLILQAEGIRYGVEHWRRNMHRVSGTLYWQLNDCWPVASWASIDYFGRWKALHYAAKRFYSPLLLSIEDHPPIMDLHISNDLTSSKEVLLEWSLETIVGDRIDSGQINVIASPLANTFVHSFDFNDQVNTSNEREVIFVCELWDGPIRIATQISTFVPNKHVSFSNPGLKVEINQQDDMLILSITSKSIARFVELKFEGVDVVFSDNYFDIPAGRKVIITCPIPEGWDIETAKQTLRTYSLYDSF
jgi:beta-mannosidase